MMTKAFFSIELNDYVLDGMCKCGHLERDHGSQCKKTETDKLIRVNNGGSCCAGKCKCKHFEWSRWVTATEFSDTIVANQSKRLSMV